MSARWPRPLPPGGTIGICSPAGPPPDGALERARRRLEARGYRVVLAPRAGAAHAAYPYLAGTADERAADLQALLADPSIDLVLCARGGYGSMHLLDRIDYEAVRRDPKPVVGYSDISALTLALWARADVVSFSGPMATGRDGFSEETMDPDSTAGFFAAVSSPARPLVLPSLPGDPPWIRHRGGGLVQGPVVPVCLSLLETLMGTPYQPDLTGAILVIEDTHEAVYAVDRSLTQLRLAGLLDRLTALLIGSFNGTDEDEALAAAVPQLAREMTPSHVAVASGVAYGHQRRRLTLPVGARATVDLDAGVFAFD